MRLLVVSSYRFINGGRERYLQRVISGLLDRGHEVGLLYEYEVERDSELIDPPTPPIKMWCLAEQGSRNALASIRDWHPDVVYFNGLDHHLAVEDALLEVYPVVLFLHDYNRTCATGTKQYSFPRPQNCRRSIGPMCLVLHYPRRCGGLHPFTMWRGYREHMDLHLRLSRHSAILVASAYMYDELKRHDVSLRKLHLIPYPPTDVTADVTPPVPKAFTDNILFLGRLTDLKGVDFLIQAVPEAARKLNRALNLTVAGEGPYSDRLRTLAHQLNAPVQFFGWADTQAKIDLIRRADLMAVPSLWPEPFGLVGIEAGCMGVPSVAYDVGGISDWLIPGESGELANSNPPTIQGLADAIAKALQSPAHYAKLRQGAWNVAKRFTLNDHLDRLERILSSVTVQKTRPAIAGH